MYLSRIDKPLRKSNNDKGELKLCNHARALTQLDDSWITQALHGLAPKCKLINMHELIYKSTNDYVTLLPCENGSNVNNKG